jgi:hypothetical protein
MNGWVRVSNPYGGPPADSTTVTVTVVPYAPFTDNTLTAGSTGIKTVHFTELRTRIDVVRARYGLGAYPYTRPTLAPGVGLILAAEIAPMRLALAEAYNNAHVTPPTYTTSPGVGSGIVVADIADLRAAVIALE